MEKENNLKIKIKKYMINEKYCVELILKVNDKPYYMFNNDKTNISLMKRMSIQEFQENVDVVAINGRRDRISFIADEENLELLDNYITILCRRIKIIYNLHLKKENIKEMYRNEKTYEV